MGTPGYAPPGWPAEVRPPGVPGWEREATDWLLDWSPPSWRQDPALTRYPIALARFTLAHLQSQVVAARRAWTMTTAGQAGDPDPVTRAALLHMLARVGADLTRRVAAAKLLHDSLGAGKLYTPRL